MFCSKCGKNVDDGVGFCPSCGAKIGGGATARTQQTAGDSGKSARHVGADSMNAKNPVNTGYHPRTDLQGVIWKERFRTLCITLVVVVGFFVLCGIFIDDESDGEWDEEESEEQAVVDTPQKPAVSPKKSMNTESEPDDGVVMTGSDFIKEWEWIWSSERTSAQQQERFKRIKGRKVAFDFDNAYIEDVRKINSTEQALQEMTGTPIGKVEVIIVSEYSSERELRMELYFSDKNKALNALNLSKGTKVKNVTGRVGGAYWE